MDLTNNKYIEQMKKSIQSIGMNKSVGVKRKQHDKKEHNIKNIQHTMLTLVNKANKKTI